MQYSSRIKQKTLEELTPARQKQIEIATLLEDMVTNNQGWKIYESWLEDQYLQALTSIKTCTQEELLEYQVIIRLIESLKAWMINTIEKGHEIRTKLISETKEKKNG